MTTTENQLELDLNRRQFLQQGGVGLRAIALQSLLAGDAASAPVKIDPTNPMSPRRPPLAARAKRIIYLFMAGGRVSSNCSTTSPSCAS